MGTTEALGRNYGPVHVLTLPLKMDLPGQYQYKGYNVGDSTIHATWCKPLKLISMETLDVLAFLAPNNQVIIDKCFEHQDVQ